MRDPWMAGLIPSWMDFWLLVPTAESLVAQALAAAGIWSYFAPDLFPPAVLGAPQ